MEQYPFAVHTDQSGMQKKGLVFKKERLKGEKLHQIGGVVHVSHPVGKILADPIPTARTVNGAGVRGIAWGIAKINPPLPGRGQIIMVPRKMSPFPSGRQMAGGQKRQRRIGGRQGCLGRNFLQKGRVLRFDMDLVRKAANHPKPANFKQKPHYSMV